MKKIVAPTAALALLAGLSIAYAADATGVIKSIDPGKDVVTLDNGSTYMAPSSVKLSMFKVGEKVTVTYATANGKMEASAIKPAT
jgi:Cu/Ag efflux protein CusF